MGEYGLSAGDDSAASGDDFVLVFLLFRDFFQISGKGKKVKKVAELNELFAKMKFIFFTFSLFHFFTFPHFHFSIPLKSLQLNQSHLSYRLGAFGCCIKLQKQKFRRSNFSRNRPAR